jgi:hypothetical protein
MGAIVGNAAMVSEINVRFAASKVDELELGAFKPGLSTADAIKALGLEDVDYVGQYVRAMPKAIVDAMMGAICSALTSDPRSTVTVAWMESPKYGLQVSEAPAFAETGRGAVTMVLTGPLTP